MTYLNLAAAALLVGFGALPTCLAAQEADQSAVTLHLDPAATEIHFATAGLLHKHGSFKLKLGQIAFDPHSGVAQGQVLVDAQTGQTGDRKFDAKMQNDVLQSGKYPEIFFHAETVKGTLRAGEQHLRLTGTLNVHGADHPLTVDADVTVKGDAVTAKTSFDVPVVAWGMKEESSLLFRGREVHVDVLAHGTVEGLK